VQRARHGRPRRAQEWRHQNGMRALGIPNNKNFFEVTQIKDALELWTSIQARRPPARPPRLARPATPASQARTGGSRVVAAAALGCWPCTRSA